MNMINQSLLKEALNADTEIEKKDIVLLERMQERMQDSTNDEGRSSFWVGWLRDEDNLSGRLTNDISLMHAFSMMYIHDYHSFPVGVCILYLQFFFIYEQIVTQLHVFCLK